MSASCASPSSSDPSPADPAPDGADTPAAPGAAPTSSKPLEASAASVTILASTADGLVAFTRGDGAAKSLSVLDVDTRKETPLAERFGAGDRVVVAGRAIAAFAGGELSVAVKGAGVRRLGSAVPGIFAASADGSRLAWARASGAGADVTTQDAGGAPSAVIAGVATGDSACEIRLGFAGDRLLASTCAAGGTTATLRSVDRANTVKTVLTSARGDWSADDAGEQVFVVTSAGTGSVRSLVDGHVIAIDADVAWGTIAPNGDFVVYRTTRGVLKKAEFGGPSVDRTTIATGIQGIAAVSSSYLYALASTSAASTGTLSDLEVEPIPPGKPFIPTPTKPMLLEATRTAFALGFTPDGDRAVYLSDVATQGLAVGTLKAHAVAKDDEVVFAHDAFSPSLVPGSSRVVFGSHPKLEGGRLVAVDLEEVDVAGGATAPVSLATNVDPAFAVTGSAVVYAAKGEIVTKPLP